MPLPQRDEPSSRAWPRCEPASTHFELGASADYRPTAVMAKRYSPRYGVRSRHGNDPINVVRTHRRCRLAAMTDDDSVGDYGRGNAVRDRK